MKKLSFEIILDNYKLIKLIKFINTLSIKFV